MTTKLLLAAMAFSPFIAANALTDDEIDAKAEEQTAIGFNAGADLRIRHETMKNIPQMGRATGYRTQSHMRFRPRVWAELTAGENWRLYGRILDEFRWGIARRDRARAQTWPGEVEVDNIYLEGKGLLKDAANWFDSMDIVVGRQDIMNLYGLDHIFIDGTSGDGSRSTHSDMVRMAFHFTEDSTLDVFGMINKDREYMRLGTHRSQRAFQLTGFGGNETEMDDWAFGAVWSSKVDFLNYQLFGIQKNTASFHDRAGGKHPRRQVNLLGTKLVPHWTTNLSTPFEVMAQIGRNGEGDTLAAWAGYAGVEWKDMEKKSWRPFFSTGVLALSGDKHAGTEDGGHHGWDPMWYRGVNDSEMMLYGSNYGTGWWSNMYNFKTTVGMEIAKNHTIAASAGPMFAQVNDGLGGGNGHFKGFLTHLRYDFPLWPCPCTKNENPGRFEVFGHLLVEWFNPGDYYETDRPAFFFRWQIDFKF